MTRYGILGFGNHGVSRLIPGFAGAKVSSLAGIWRRDAQKARSQANELGIARVFSSAEDLCASPDIDAVLVSSPDALHMHDTLLALSHRKPVLCEKPAAMNAGQVEQMVAAAHTAKLVFGIAQNFRYNRSVNLIREWVQQGRIGVPVFASAQFCFLADRSPRRWIYDPKLACGGPIGDVGIHCIDALRYVLSDDISAVTTIARGDAESAAVEATAALALEFTRGTLGSIQVSFRAKYHTGVEVIGEDGVIQTDDGLTVDHPVQVMLRKKGQFIDKQAVVNSDAYSLMLDAFSAAIAGRGIYAAPGEDGINNQRTLDAAYASLHAGSKQGVKIG